MAFSFRRVYTATGFCFSAFCCCCTAGEKKIDRIATCCVTSFAEILGESIGVGPWNSTVFLYIYIMQSALDIAASLSSACLAKK